MNIIGCDIHCFVEKRQADGSWEQIFGFVSDYYDADNDYFKGESFSNAVAPIDSRSYTVFAVLADVRNGHGFAGCDTGNAVEPIAHPKGLPDDCCDAIRKDSDEWDCDGHSHSFLTVAEMEAYNADVLKTVRGIVHVSEYLKCRESGEEPHAWCGMISGPGIEIVTQEAIDKISIEEVKHWCAEFPDLAEKHHVKMEWTVPLKEHCGKLFTDSLDQLKARCDSPEMDDVRIVFWFDN